MTREEFGTVTMSNDPEHRGEVIATGVVRTVLELWPSPSFARDWNGANREIAFRMLSPFAEHEVLDVFQNHRFDNPSDREPRFKEVAAKLWQTRRAREEHADKGQAVSLPSWPTILEWAGRKSDDDLAHLWQVVTDRYQSIADCQDKLWTFLNSCEPRSAAHLTIAWAVEHDIELTFKRGTDEWFAVMDEHDRIQRDKIVAEYANRRVNATTVIAPASCG